MRATAEIIQRGEAKTTKGGFIAGKYVMRRYQDGLLEVLLFPEFSSHDAPVELGQNFDLADLINQVRLGGYLLHPED